jgi:hypothetical protein
MKCQRAGFRHQRLCLREHQRGASAITSEDNAARRAEFSAMRQKPPSYKAFRRFRFCRAGNRQAPPAARARSQNHVEKTPVMPPLSLLKIFSQESSREWLGPLESDANRANRPQVIRAKPTREDG